MNNINGKLTQFNANDIVIHTPDNKQITGVDFNGDTVHYLNTDNPFHPLTNVGLPIHVGCQNDQTMQSSQHCLPDLPDFSDEACEGHMLSRRTHNSLVPIGKLCYAGCIAVLKSKQITIKHNNQIFIQEPIYRSNGS